LSSKLNTQGIWLDENVSTFSETKISQENPELLVKQETQTYLKNFLFIQFDFSELTAFLNDTFIKVTIDEKRSIKLKQKQWAIDLETEVNALKTHADNFINYLNSLFVANQSDLITILTKRVGDAIVYFTPFLKEFSLAVFKQLHLIKNEKKIKTYWNELMELELKFYEQIKKLHKVNLLLKSVSVLENAISKTAIQLEYDSLRKEEFNKLLNQNTSNVDDFNDSAKSKKKSSIKKEKKKKAIDIPTQEQSFILFKEGKSVSEIAAERGFSVNTIEGHLVSYVAQGILDVSKFVSTEKVDCIKKVSLELNTLQLKPIKDLLGDDYSFSDIRFALAARISEDV
jgi:hypothetical protein